MRVGCGPSCLAPTGVSFDFFLLIRFLLTIIYRSSYTSSTETTQRRWVFVFDAVAHVEHGNPPILGAFSHSTSFHTRRARKPPNLGAFSCSTPLPTHRARTHPIWVRFRVRHRSIHVEHGNTLNMGVFLRSTPFRTRQARKPPNMGAFSCSTPVHTRRAQKHTQRRCVFVFGT